MMAGLAGLVRSREYVWVTEDAVKSLPLALPLDDGLNECPVVDIDRCRPKQRPKPPGRNDVITRVTEPAHIDMPGMAGMGGMSGTSTFDLAAARKKGVFELLPCDSQVLAVHATVLHTGKVLFFAGSGNDELYTTGLRSVVWDYENGGFYTPYTPIDLFCAGQAFLPDGRLLVVGGTLNYGFTGLDTAFMFDPLAEEWIRVGNMQGRRWYPTAVELSGGDVLAAGGTDWAHTFEVYNRFTGWASPLPTPGNWPAYPNMLLLRDGRVFFTGIHFDAYASQPVIFDVTSNTMTSVGGLAPPDGRGMGASVLLPPAQSQRVMALGGGGTGAGSIRNTSIVDLSVAAPAYVNGPKMVHPRTMQNAVILPDRNVFVSGGGQMGEMVGAAQLESEIYDSAANVFRAAATALVPRLYHSIALLLPDARVITAGSNPNRRDDELRLELFHPPYLFRGPRPSIESAPDEVTHGERFQIGTPNASEIRWAQLVKPMAVTHSCDTEQRLVDLPIVRGSRHLCRLDVRVPREPGVAPPGWYMLFLTNTDGVPSHAHWIRVAG
jgi:hypothetical protein